MIILPLVMALFTNNIVTSVDSSERGDRTRRGQSEREAQRERPAAAREVCGGARA